MQINKLTEFVEIMNRGGLGDKWLEADHNIIYGPTLHDIDEKVSPADIKRLEEFGWFRDEDIEGLAHHC